MSALMELELGLALSSKNNNHLEMEKFKGHKNKKRGYNFDHDSEVESKALSLFLWSGQSNYDDDSSPEKWRKLHVNSEDNDEENHEMVGWPPITSSKKESRHGGRPADNHREVVVEQVLPVRNSTYVKVKMEGEAIGRKIDLGLYNSFSDLTSSLIDMFAKYGKSQRDYIVLYKDEEGDWMLAGDVPWETFIESVQRMEIQRNDN